MNRRLTGLNLARRPSETSDEIRGPLGLNLLYEPSEPLIDFIFVHGLRGGSRKTWSKTESIAHYWPQEWLPLEPEFKHVRIHSFGYNSDWGERKGSSLTIHDFGQALIGDIYTSPHLNRQPTPLVFVGHSMGGIVIKKAFLLAKQDPNLHGLAARFHSIFFLATPHRGADSVQLLENMMRISGTLNPKAYVSDIKPNSGVTQSINDEFRHVYQGTQLWSFFETVSTSLGIIVEKDSAVLGLPKEIVHLLNADHRHVCKFEDPSDNNYRTIRNAFSTAIAGIEKTWYPSRRDDHRKEMKTLSQYLGVPERPEADLANAVDKRTDGSCTWLTDHGVFHHWLEGIEPTPKFFWLTGEPATGKSVLAGHVVDYLVKCSGDSSYFFFKHGDTTRSTVSDLLRSLAWQMAYTNTDIRHHLLDMAQNGESVEKNDERSLWRSLFVNRIFQTKLRQPLRWVIDALDECSNNAALFPLLAKIDKQFPLHIFLTSRPSPSLEMLFEKEKIPKLRVSVTQETSLSDIRLFVESQNRYLPVDDDDLEGRDDLIDQIVRKSNGNFLWTSLVLQELATANSEAQIRDILRLVPTEMDSFYRRILDGLLAVPRNIPLAKAILRWTVCAARPLTVEELKDAVKYDIGEVVPRLEKTAGAICGHLVHVDNNMRVQITHATVRAFLVGEDVASPSNASEFAIVRIKEHSRLAKLCLDFLSGPEMKPPRYRRGNVTGRSSKRPAFADYAVANFAEHIAKATSAEDAHLFALNSFLQTNVLTWIQVVAASGDLQPLVQTTKQLKTYIERRSKYIPPMGVEVQTISSWTTDLVHIIAEFGKTLLAAPTSIHFLIPPLCPTNSMISRAAQENPRGFRVTGLSQQEWDDRLSCIVLPNIKVLSVSSCDNRFSLGLSDSSVHVYNNTTFQEEIQLSNGEPVRMVKFANVNPYLVTASRKTIRLWNVASGTMLWSVTSPGQALAIEYSEEDTQLMVATQANTMSIWHVADGTLVDTFHFKDIDEDEQVDFRYQRPATFAAISPGLNLLAVAYRQRPITLWDLSDNTFLGQFHKSATTYPWPLIVALLFNPKPDIQLAAVAYQSGEILVFDPFSLRQCANVTAEATVLAASPNGTVLAVGHGSSGIVSLYDFETLKLLYRLNSYEEDIKAIVFTSNSMRFIDIRGEQCNVWEPPVLMRLGDPGDDSSLGFSEEAPAGPQIATSRTYDDDLMITALVAHHDADLIFCGRENGSVAVYSTQTGKSVQELFNRRRNVAILSLTWNARRDLLGVADRSTHVAVHVVSKTVSGKVSVTDPIVDIEMGSIIRQVLFSPDGAHVLISTADSDVLWKMEDRMEVARRPAIAGRESWSWTNHPGRPTQLLLICNGRAYMFSWDSLSPLTKPEGIELMPPTDPSLLVSDSIGSPLGRNLCLRFLRPRTSRASSQFCLWPSENLRPELEHTKSLVSYPGLAAQMKCIIGLSKMDLLFLDHDGWVCSLKIESVAKERFYMKHFFIPYGWHSSRGNLAIGITEKGAVFMAVRDELAVFHHGLEMEEKTPIEDADVRAVPSMRSSRR